MTSVRTCLLPSTLSIESSAAGLPASSDGVQLRPRFVAGGDGSARYLIDFCPPTTTTVVGTVLCIQPFGDEATLSRRVLVAGAIRLAARGWVVRLADLEGTGDSAGDDEDASLSTWRADLDLFARGLRDDWPGQDVVLWGVRLGCALACDLFQRSAPNDYAALLLWQPGRSAADALAPWLRLARIGARTRESPAAGGVPAADSAAAALPVPNRDDEDRSWLALGGFRFQRELIEALGALPLAPPAVPGSDDGGTGTRGHRALILGMRRDLSGGRQAGGPPEELAALGRQWDDAGCASTCQLVAVEPFWNSLEPSTPSAAFEATEGFLGGQR